MPYRYLEDIATADVAFEAWGQTLGDMFVAAAEASMNVMVEDLNRITDVDRRRISLTAESLEMLLFDFIQELIYYKDAEQLLLRISEISIKLQNDSCHLQAETYGELLDPGKHQLNADVKAVTMHRFAVDQTPQGWQATVVLDI